jgi:cephalosporin hydroxylase
VVRRAARRALRPALVPVAVRRLRRQAAAARDLPELLDVAFGFELAGINIEPLQIRSEIEALLAHLERLRPRVVVEIGTAHGGTLFLLSRVAAHDALIVSVDLPGGAFGGGYPAWRAPLYRSFRRERQRIELLRADSHEHATVERVRAIAGGAHLDVLLIDGDHSYEGVSQDYECYGPLVRAGGVVILHDIVESTAEAREHNHFVGDVPEFWRQVSEGRERCEFVEDPAQGYAGIGVLMVRGPGGREVHGPQRG